jgi:predicted dehydrogenase
MKLKKLNTIIIGLGKIGYEYDLNKNIKKSIKTHGRAISLHSKFELKAGIDTSLKQRDQFTNIYNVPCFKNFSLASELESINFVIIATPTKKHLSSIKEVVTFSKPLAILLEKPISDNILDAKKIIQICKENSITLYINYIRKSDPGIIKIKKIVEGEVNNKKILGKYLIFERFYT